LGKSAGCASVPAGDTQPSIIPQSELNVNTYLQKRGSFLRLMPLKSIAKKVDEFSSSTFQLN